MRPNPQSRAILRMGMLCMLLGYGTAVAGATANAGSAVLSTNADGTATLNGTASAGATVTWSKLTGLGTVSFSPSNNAATTVTCSQAGVYILRLSATDGGGTATSNVQVEIVPPGGLTNSESADGFSSWFTGSDLSNFRSHGGQPIPTGDPNWFAAAGGIIRHVHGGPNLMSRSEYSFGVLRFEWSGNMDSGLLVLQPFGSNGGFDNQIQMGYRSGGYFGSHPGLGALVNESTPPGWNDWEFSILPDGNGNPVATLRVSTLNGGSAATTWSGIGTGVGYATPQQGGFTPPGGGAPISVPFAPRGFIGFQQESGGFDLRNVRFKPVGTLPPVVSAGGDRSVSVGQNVALGGSLSGPGAYAAWSVNSGPGTVTFSNAADPGASASFSAAGTYVLQLYAFDGKLRAFSYATITATSGSPLPPTISTQPANQSMNVGQAATFMVVAGGSAPYSYQWYRNGSAIGGATANTYSTGATTLADSGTTFAVVVNNSVGPAVTSTTVTLTVSPPPSDSVSNGGFEQPSVASFAYAPGGAWTFTGNAGIQHNGSVFTAAAPEGVQTAFLQGNNGLGTLAQTLSLSAARTFQLTFKAARRSGQAQPLKVTLGGQVLASAYTPAGNAFESWTSASVSLAAGSAVLQLESTDNSGDKTTFVDDVQLVQVTATAPQISAQPVGLSVIAGTAASFTVQATGSAPLHYQWRRGATAVGGDSASFSIPLALAADAGSYTVTVSNGVSPDAVSSPAVLTVTPRPGDANGDGVVNAADLNLVLGQFGKTNASAGWDARTDLDGNGRVDAGDLGAVLRTQGR